jgi:phosphatidylglycerol---prolipoprotein diacylglyceryl transferase
VNTSSFHLGPLHLPVFGIFAAVGLMAALLLSQRTAIAVDIPAEMLWNAGLFAILSAFVVSRLLLVAFNLRGFLAYPMLLLSLPSLTYTGIWITCLLTFLYLRAKRLPLLPVLDAAAPCAAVVWLALSIGHFVEGTDAGMPTRLPWGIVTSGDTVLGRVHPVQIYAALAALALGVALLWMLPRRVHQGDAAVLLLLVGGTIDFLLSFLRQPAETFGDAWLDPGQAVALLLILGGAVLFVARRPLVEEGNSHAE